MSMTNDEIKAACEVMQAAARGEAVQWCFRIATAGNENWQDLVTDPGWDWQRNRYRIKPRTPREWWGWLNKYEPFLADDEKTARQMANQVPSTRTLVRITEVLP
jgi:hypothetical protein